MSEALREAIDELKNAENCFNFANNEVAEYAIYRLNAAIALVDALRKAV